MTNQAVKHREMLVPPSADVREKRYVIHQRLTAPLCAAIRHESFAIRHPLSPVSKDPTARSSRLGATYFSGSCHFTAQSAPHAERRPLRIRRRPAAHGDIRGFNPTLQSIPSAWLDPCLCRITGFASAETIDIDSGQENLEERTADYRSGTGRSAKLNVGPIIGLMLSST